MNVNTWLKGMSRMLSPLDAEIIMCEALDLKDRSELVLKGDKELTDREERVACELAYCRLDGEPMAYILGRKEFFGRDFDVDENVLIPRVETEDMIYMVLDYLKTEPKKRKVLDVGTGSGCIAITLKLERPELEVSASDVAWPALAATKFNAEDFGVKIELIESDLLREVKKKPEIIVANLPYVDPKWEWTSPEIEYEPRWAIFAEDGGLEIIFRLLDEIKDKWYNEKDIELFLEADPSQHERIIERAEKLGFKYIKSQRYILEFRY